MKRDRSRSANIFGQVGPERRAAQSGHVGQLPQHARDGHVLQPNSAGPLDQIGIFGQSRDQFSRHVTAHQVTGAGAKCRKKGVGVGQLGQVPV